MAVSAVAAVAAVAWTAALRDSRLELLREFLKVCFIVEVAGQSFS